MGEWNECQKEQEKKIMGVGSMKQGTIDFKLYYVRIPHSLDICKACVGIFQRNNGILFCMIENRDYFEA